MIASWQYVALQGNCPSYVPNDHFKTLKCQLHPAWLAWCERIPWLDFLPIDRYDKITTVGTLEVTVKDNPKVLSGFYRHGLETAARPAAVRIFLGQHSIQLPPHHHGSGGSSQSLAGPCHR